MSEHLSQAIADYLAFSRNTGHSSPKLRKFYVSDMGSCLRVRWLKRKGIEQEFEPFVNWTLQIGNMYHDYAYKALEAKGLLVASEETLENEHFKGRFDGKVLMEDRVRQAIADIKSIGGWKLGKLVETDIPDSNYIAQLFTYLIMLHDEGLCLDIDTGILLFINKEPSAKVPLISKQVERTLTKHIEDGLRQEMATLVEHWENNTVPPCTCEAWKKKDYNNYYPLCSADVSTVYKVVEQLNEGKRLLSIKSGVYVINTDNTRTKIL